MRPQECGTHRLPPDGTADREEVDAFRQFLAESVARGALQTHSDPAWLCWAAGTAPAPAVWQGPAVPR